MVAKESSLGNNSLGTDTLWQTVVLVCRSWILLLHAIDNAVCTFLTGLVRIRDLISDSSVHRVHLTATRLECNAMA